MSKSRSISRWLPLLVWIGFIFVFSTDSFSSAQTSRVIVPALKFLLPSLSPEQLQLAHAVCRKAGHIFEYFVLGALAWRAFTFEFTGWMRAGLLTMVLVLVVALTDEFHQSFVPSRTAALTDVGYDFIGGLAAVVVLSRHRNETGTVHSHSVL